MKKFYILFAILLTCSCVLADCYKIPAQLTKITDGDTIEVKINKNKFPVRLIGIDCYETGKIHRAYKQAYLNNLTIEEITKKGKASKEFLENLYQNSNKNVYLDFKGLDIYKRALGVIYFDKLNVNKAMTQGGGCMVYDYK